MSYANYFELTRCLDDCLEYCRKFPDREHSEFHCSLLENAKQHLKQSTDKSNKEFTEWRMESRVDRLAWKHLARDLQSVQRKLKSVNAVGFLDQKVMYWYQAALIAAVDQMIDYLSEHKDDLDFAADEIEKLGRQKEKALSEVDESGRALNDYLRYSKLRADALTETKDTIANFRRTLRRDLGVRDEDYQAIHWPQQVASDNRVL